MMTGKMVAGALLVCGILGSTGLAAAQEAPTKAAGEEGHASGLMVQARLQGQGGLLALGAGSGFLLGYQGPSYALGLGLGFNRVGLSAGSNSSGSLTLFQVMPTALIDVWRSRDGRARANVIGGIGYGRGSLSGTGRNFALGAELGVQAAFTAGIDTTDNGVSRGVDASGNLQLAYGALRATFVLGD